MADTSQILGAISALMGAYPNYKRQQRADTLEERKLGLQELAAMNKEPSAGISNIKFLESKYGHSLPEDQAMGLLSPAGLLPAEYRVSPDKIREIADAKRPKLDLGSTPQDAPRPLIQPKPTSDNIGPAFTPGNRDTGNVPADKPAPNSPEQPAKIRMKFNPATGTVEPVAEFSLKMKFEDL